MASQVSYPPATPISTTQPMGRYNLAIIGDRAVGKYTLAHRFSNGAFIDERNPFEDGNNTFRRQCMIDTQVALVDVEVPRTAGQGIYAILKDEHLQNKDGVLLSYSTTSKSSFQAVQELESQIFHGKPPTVPVILIGMKCDLEEQREVPTHAGFELAQRLGCPFMEVSAKWGSNVDEAFCDVVRLVRKCHPEDKEQPTTRTRSRSSQSSGTGSKQCVVA